MRHCRRHMLDIGGLSASVRDQTHRGEVRRCRRLGVSCDCKSIFYLRMYLPNFQANHQRHVYEFVLINISDNFCELWMPCTSFFTFPWWGFFHQSWQSRSLSGGGMLKQRCNNMPHTDCNAQYIPTNCLYQRTMHARGGGAMIPINAKDMGFFWKCPSGQGWRSDFRGGWTRFQGAQGDPI